jgi:hypothetical protein
VLGAGTVDTKVVAGITTDGTDKLTVGTVDLAGGTANTLSGSGGVLSIEGVKVLATNSTSGTQQGLVAVNSSSGAVVGTIARSAGGSSSGTAGTAIASITAGGGNQFVCLNGVATQASAAGTQYTVTVTYSDSTTTTITSAATSSNNVWINDAALMMSGTPSQTIHSAKKITGLSFITAGTGTGLRQGSISAIEIPQ